MAPQTAKSLMKDFRASFRRKKVDHAPKIDKVKELEEEELAKLAELKENFGENLPPGYNDADLLGFIRARSLNVKEAEKLLKIDVTLKKMILLDTIVKEYDVTDLSKKFSCSGVIGCDKEGCLVRIMNIGLCDIKGFVHCVSTIENFKIFLWFLENDRLRMEQENKKCGRKKTQMTYILDLANVNVSTVLSKPVLDTGLVAIKLLQDHYHDITKLIFMINAPALFPSAFKMFKPVIQESLQKKIKIFGSDGYKEEFLKHIDADVLPAYLGGNRVDSNNDPQCKELIGTGGIIPPSYYPDHFLDESEEGIQVVTVSAGSSFSVRYNVPCEGTIIHYYVHSKDNDIGIGVFLDKDGEQGEKKQKKKDEDISQLTQLIPIIRSQCQLCPEVGSFTTWFSGTIVFYLDNTYSWMSSKEVIYKIDIEKPSLNKPPVFEHIRKEVMVPIKK